MIMVSEKYADENQSYFTQRIRDHRSIKRLKGVYIHLLGVHTKL